MAVPEVYLILYGLGGKATRKDLTKAVHEKFPRQSRGFMEIGLRRLEKAKIIKRTKINDEPAREILDWDFIKQCRQSSFIEHGEIVTYTEVPP